MGAPLASVLLQGICVYCVLSTTSGITRPSLRDHRPSRSANPQSDTPKLTSTEQLMSALEFMKRFNADNCSRSGSQTLPVFDKGFPLDSYARFKAQARTAIKTANILNNLLRFRNAPLQDEYFYSLAGANIDIDKDSAIAGSTIAFDSQSYNNRDFCPAIFRRGDSLVAIDVATASGGKYAFNDTVGYEWFWRLRPPPGDNEVYSSNLWDRYCEETNPYENMGQGQELEEVVLSTEELGHWSTPYFDCDGAKTWLVTYSVPFFGCRTGVNQLMFRGVVAVGIDLQLLDINQCATDGSLFADTHNCQETTKCIHMSGKGFIPGAYQCHCVDGYYFRHEGQEGANSYFNGSVMEEQRRSNQSDVTSFKCLPCQAGCNSCLNAAPCLARYDVLLRGIPLGIQSFCMTISIVLGLVILRLRRSKVMKASMWIMLEILLVGALLLYATVLIQYFQPTTATCLLIPWFREVGFAVVYGALILKIYRVLAEFQSRKAHRVHVRDQDLLKYLLGVVLVVVGYMSAWTAVNMDHVREGNQMLDVGTTSDQLKYYICKAFWWDYVIEAGEFLFLCLGIYLCYCVRTAPSDYGEIRYISMAIYLETVFSALLHILRHFIWLVIHPDYIFLMYFIRCQLTVTVALVVVLGPKLWYAHRPPEDEHFRNRAYSSSDVHDTILPESMKLHVGISSNGDVDVGEINLAEMDPEDIRAYFCYIQAELKRLYTQLQIYKTKTMRKDNPHISKRRGGRKQTHRRFSLQAFHYKHRHHHAPDHDHDHELSKTPEESTNSAEGVAIQMEGSSRGEEDRTPTVTFKPGHKAFS